jgi:hypothetical protein
MSGSFSENGVQLSASAVSIAELNDAQCGGEL